MNTRQVVSVSLIAALYVVLTVGFAPISYGPLQFRVGEVLKSLALFDPIFIVGFAVGNFISNITSPYAGPWELLFMPFANVVGAYLCWRLRRWPYAGAIVFAATITLAVSTMLNAVLGIPWQALIWTVGIPEVALIVGGVPLMTRVWAAISEKRGGRKC